MNALTQLTNISSRMIEPRELPITDAHLYLPILNTDEQSPEPNISLPKGSSLPPHPIIQRPSPEGHIVLDTSISHEGDSIPNNLTQKSFSFGVREC
jgi:hypothetical protein